MTQTHTAFYVRRQRSLASSLWVFLGLAMATSCITSRAQAQEKGPVLDYSQSFKGKPENSNGLELIGPDAQSCVQFEPDGLRITLPPNHPVEKPTGVATGFAVKGDFEITLRYELLHEPEPIDAGDFGTRLALAVGFDAPGENAIKFTRAVRTEGGSQYIAFSSEWNRATKKLDKRNKSYPTTAKQGRLRLARQGDILFFGSSESSVLFP